jgi:hypothetical protein
MKTEGRKSGKNAAFNLTRRSLPKSRANCRRKVNCKTSGGKKSLMLIIVAIQNGIVMKT